MFDQAVGCDLHGALEGNTGATFGLVDAGALDGRFWASWAAHDWRGGLVDASK
jgi:hypothetical protein